MHKFESKASIIIVDSLSKKFGNRPLFSDISFSIEAGEIVALLGPNGSGRTTILNILLGLMLPESGKIKIFGLPLEENLQFIRKGINYASAFTQLQGYSTVEENLNTFAGLYQVQEKRKKIKRLLQTFRLSDQELKSRKVYKLSTGENAKLNLCKAWLNEPRILLLDEPTAGLDSSAKMELIHLIKYARKKNQTTVLYATNDEKEAGTLCNRALVLENGKLSQNRNFRKYPL